MVQYYAFNLVFLCVYAQLYWYFQQHQCLNIKKQVLHNIYRLTWDPYACGAPGQLPVCPCAKTALSLLIQFSTSVYLHTYGSILCI